MTTYGKPVVPVVPGPEAYRLSDTYVISQPIPHPEVYTPPVDTLAGGLSWTGVMEAISEGPQSHAEGRNHGPRVPGWALVCLFAGMALIGLALVMAFVVIPLGRLW